MDVLDLFYRNPVDMISHSFPIQVPLELYFDKKYIENYLHLEKKCCIFIYCYFNEKKT